MKREQRLWRLPLCALGCLALCLCAADSAMAGATVYGSGVVEPISQPGVYAKVDASVADVLVEMGDSVQAGDLLMVLENDELAAEVASIEYDVYIAEDEVMDVKTRERFNYIPRVDPKTGGYVTLGGTDEIIYERYSNALNVRSPIRGRVMAVYIDVGDDALSVFREKGAIIVISTDGKMKVELSGLEGKNLELDQKVMVRGEGFETEGVVVELTRRGMEATIQVNSDKYDMDAPVTVTTLEGDMIGEGTLAVNKPYNVSAYGGIVREVSTYVGQNVNRQDVLAMFTWTSEPLYLDNAASLVEYTKKTTLLENAREKLQSLAIVAPCSGKVASIDVALDDSVEDGTKLLTIVEDAGMQVILKVDELDIVQVAPGQKVTLELHALEGVTLTGTVKKIAPLGDTETSVTRYDVYVTLDETDARVKGGMNVSGEIHIE